MLLETERLLLRTYEPDDLDALRSILSDPVTMQYYPAPFDDEKVADWIRWNRQSYRENGFGLWAAVLKETHRLIGDCGVTMQLIDGERLPEIGYHIHRDFWRQGYGKEAALAVRDWFFGHTEENTVYSYMNSANIPSIALAQTIGMRKFKEYRNHRDVVTSVYRITRKEWRALTGDA